MKVDGTELEAVLALAGVAPVAEDTDELKALVRTSTNLVGRR